MTKKQKSIVMDALFTVQTMISKSMIVDTIFIGERDEYLEGMKSANNRRALAATYRRRGKTWREVGKLLGVSGCRAAGLAHRGEEILVKREKMKELVP